MEEEAIYSFILDLFHPDTREQALSQLAKRRETFEDLAVVLWNSYGVMSILLQEIVTVYPLLDSDLPSAISNRVCNSLALLQCVASHTETRLPFLSTHFPYFLYPMLNTTDNAKPFEYLRLTALGVIGALVKQDSPEVVSFLLNTEIIPICLRIMNHGAELSKTVAIFILQKILQDDYGLLYICQTYERFSAVITVLENMVMHLTESQSSRLLKHVIRCYLRLAENQRAREALRACLPGPLRDNTFVPVIKDDVVVKRALNQLLITLSEGGMTAN
ncbi:cell differentiation protein rcd1 [Basidiobolus meristosporus CBS 931.73]|uniref:Cell differentiation protein rcd1 n=1 Tax=Basidiobolus meristosporus CBS 931.73 TaxID=1314790 RepID=A0A1Y1ZE78_9FUNG|nr:cell differentiation protein rcd1 [Basidiobolus meristosporus CBS 931.73]|eukprot:ORY08125.1 cell differentiation protein rcd1 [Basidiobolus meristosporus CBS 931.73]